MSLVGVQGLGGFLCPMSRGWGGRGEELYSMVIWEPPSSQQNDRYTYVKTLPSRNFVRKLNECDFTQLLRNWKAIFGKKIKNIK